MFSLSQKGLCACRESNIACACIIMSWHVMNACSIVCMQYAFCAVVSVAYYILLGIECGLDCIPVNIEIERDGKKKC